MVNVFSIFKISHPKSDGLSRGIQQKGSAVLSESCVNATLNRDKGCSNLFSLPTLKQEGWVPMSFVSSVQCKSATNSTIKLCCNSSSSRRISSCHLLHTFEVTDILRCTTAVSPAFQLAVELNTAITYLLPTAENRPPASFCRQRVQFRYTAFSAILTLLFWSSTGPPQHSCHRGARSVFITP